MEAGYAHRIPDQRGNGGNRTDRKSNRPGADHDALPCAKADVSGQQQKDIHAGRQPCDDFKRVRHYFRSH